MIDYRSMLAEASEPDLVAFTRKIVPGKERITGVRVPAIRSIAKRILKDDWRLYLEDVPETYEEELLRALVIATAPMDTDERISMTDGFMPYVDNWSTCDLLCGSWRFPERDSVHVWDYFSSLMDTGKEFPMRVSVVMRMSHFLDDGHVDALLEDMMSHDNEGYYYRMGCAWAVSYCYVKYPGKTRAALESGRFCVWTHNKSIQKICESYRVSEEDKREMRRLRRRAP